MPDRSTPDLVPVAPHSRLSGGQFAFGLAVMVGVGLTVYAMFPGSVGGPPLPVKVGLGQEPVETVGGTVAMLTDVVTIENETDFQIKNLTVELNGLYLLTHASPLLPGERLVFPQEVFTDKRSSKRFDPERQVVDEVVVTGQLPNKKRGVSLIEFHSND